VPARRRAADASRWAAVHQRGSTMRYFAHVAHVRRRGIHMLVTCSHTGEDIRSELPLPDRVELEVDDDGCAMLYRYQNNGTFCGDTWHECIQDAHKQAFYEYEIQEHDWKLIPDE
jgi:hypothetical protein